jgi:hypothetical protein
MGKTIAIGLLAATLYAAPLKAEPASPVAPAITKQNNDASLRSPHLQPIRNRVPRTKFDPSGQPPVK